MERECEGEGCTKTFTASSVRHRFCGAACRGKAHRTPAGKAKRKDTPAVPERGGLVAQVCADLAALDALDTTRGRAALALAYRIESPLETGSAAASMTVQLTRLMDEATAAAAPRMRDGVDKLEESVGAKLKLVSG